MSYKTIGGVLDFRFFVGEKDPIDTIRALHKYIGRSLVPPFWSLGYHQSRWGY
jgi:alpha-glucosidase (family GH31 glycosyl hydrolase)